MTNDELKQKIINDQLTVIRLQRQYRDNPLACPPLPKAERQRQDAEWQEAIRRGLHHEINAEVKRLTAPPTRRLNNDD